MYARIVIAIAASAIALGVANAQTPTGPQGAAVIPGYATGTTTGIGASGGGSSGALNGNGAVGLGTVGSATMNAGPTTTAPNQAQAPNFNPSSSTNKNDCLTAVQGANLANETCGGL